MLLSCQLRSYRSLSSLKTLSSFSVFSLPRFTIAISSRSEKTALLKRCYCKSMMASSSVPTENDQDKNSLAKEQQTAVDSNNSELLDVVMSLGFPKPLVEKALLLTGGKSAEAAVAFILDNPDLLNSATLLETRGETSALHNECPAASSNCSVGNAGAAAAAYSSAITRCSECRKVVFVVNSELKMGLGKVAAQVGHAALGLYRQLPADAAEQLSQNTETAMREIYCGNSTQNLLDLYEKAKKESSLIAYKVHDAGRTQIAAGSLTVLAVYGPQIVLQEFTRGLSVLS